MAGMVPHVAISGCIAVLVNELPISLPEKAVIAISTSFLSHFVLDAIPHGEMEGGMVREFFIGFPIYLILAMISFFIRGIEVSTLFCLSGFSGMLPDGFLFVTHYFPSTVCSRIIIRQNVSNHWFRKVWPGTWMFGWRYHFLTAMGGVLAFLIVLLLL